MSSFPHHYRVQASCSGDGPVQLSAERLPPLVSMPPTAFGGPGDKWSPEDLLVASVADCFCLSFRAIATASKFAFQSLECQVVGTLDKVDRSMMFTEMNITARLLVAAGIDPDRAKRLLEKAEQSCLITNSLRSTVHLDAQVEFSS